MADMDRTLMQGKLAGLKEDRSRLELKIEGLCGGIRTELNTMVTAINDLDVLMAANHMDELKMAYAEYLGVSSQIGKLMKALHG